MQYDKWIGSSLTAIIFAVIAKYFGCPIVGNLAELSSDIVVCCGLFAVKKV